MTYRDDREVLKQRIEQLESKAASAVSPQELAELRRELVESKERLDAERDALDAVLGQLDGKGPPKKKNNVRWMFVAAGFLLSLLITAGTVTVIMVVDRRGPGFEGAEDAARQTPARREIDAEVERLFPDLDGCVPEGQHVQLQLEVIFEGHDGGLRDAISRNVSEHDRFPVNLAECLESVMHGVDIAPFRAPTYQYHVTLQWTDEGLQRPAIWDRY